MTIRAFGLTKHGLVTDGTLALPGGITTPFNQPSGGECSLIKLGSVPGVNLTATEQQDLLLKGLELLDYGLFSGNGIAGVPVAGYFIHKTSDGKRWAVDFSNLRILANQLYGNVVLTEFGNIISLDSATVPNVVTIPVSLSDTGQATPAINFVDEFNQTINISAISLDVLFEAAKPDGSECVLRIKSNYGTSTIGFLQLTLDDFVITASVLKTRAQTIGNYTKVVNNGLVAKTSMIDNTDPSYPWVDLINNTFSYALLWALVGTYSIDQAFENRLLAIQYDANSNKVEFMLNVQALTTATYDDITIGASSGQSGDSTSNATFTISAGGRSISIVASAAYSGSYSAVYNHIAAGGLIGEVTVDQTVTGTKTIDGVIYSEVETSNDVQQVIDGQIASTHRRPLSTVWSSLLSALPDFIGDIHPAIYYDGDEGGVYVLGHEKFISRVGDAKTQGNYLAQVLQRDLVSLSINWDGTAEEMKGILSPISSDDTKQDRLNGNVYQTHHPVTGQIVWNSQFPVCFV